MTVLMFSIGAFVSPFLAGVLVGFGLAVRWYGKASSSGARAVEISKTQQGSGGGEIVDPVTKRKYCARMSG